MIWLEAYSSLEEHETSLGTIHVWRGAGWTEHIGDQ
jgi:hypothetical protein